MTLTPLLLLCCALSVQLLSTAHAESVLYDDGERLHKFVEENNEEAVAQLLKEGVNPNSVEEQVSAAALL